MYLKNFFQWFLLKPKLDKLDSKPPFIKERSLWWCHFGENIGTEISGKGVKYNRPAVIYRKLSKYTFMAIPTSTKIKDGSWYIKFTHKSKEMVACINQCRIIDYRRIEKPIGELSKSDFQRIKTGFLELYK